MPISLEDELDMVTEQERIDNLSSTQSSREARARDAQAEATFHGTNVKSFTRREQQEHHQRLLNKEMNNFIQHFPNACQVLKAGHTFNHTDSSTSDDTKEVEARPNKRNVATNRNLNFSHSTIDLKRLCPSPEPLLESLEADLLQSPNFLFNFS
ncbi:hypothetical protein GLOIN_2v1791105 [Rhizophagus irregularis DAOM 181602=DAOM 197198]|uniref:Uncharacterized protein n=2 Tax=Rhizophagus irregularis TaxID=588596 RepID=A0A2P4NXQ9_RHIID|nr:hypothetical protein GLOIN_2v1791105 [Rhizophagus irregularis DAOM 181602=DAOM 197198]POG57926.1 hypothetical protein GLOIN_2v1791105 [Rhizophagus irregularis DAOM 181602=DAOM 197198]GBC39134.2 hypothetical protein GLOIN_2v1791105 [Rhizophagus irregularis DAOM 181602=DAOM 197198]|eukprot:XP_025164792.1 hypothetical protein GLOIN_2v1791105 [Rhizophagus irregularis DAOM 181602=DAOM 197198]